MKRTLAIAITVAILATILLTPAAVCAEAISLTGVTGWTAISAANDQNDFLVDQQTGSGSVSQDIVGDATDRSFFSCFDQTAGEIGFRIRVNSQDNNQYPGTAGALPTFTGYVFVGVDIGTAAAPAGDGKIDAFLGLDLHTPSSQLVGLYASNPAKENISPSTTGIGELLYSVPAIRDVTGAVKPNFAFSVAPDSSFSSDPDFFVSYKYSLAELNAAFAANGLSQLQISRDTSLHYIVGTSTQANSFNQDLNGVNKAGMGSSALFADLGMITAEVPLNHVPTGIPVNTATQMGTAVSVTVTAADADGDTLGYVLKSGTGPAHGTVVKNPDATWKYTPGAGYYGTDSFTVTASDGHGGTVDLLVTVFVNAPPVAPDVEMSLPVDATASGQFKATDPNADPVRYNFGDLSSFPRGLSMARINMETGEWTFAPLTGFVGTSVLIFNASDSHGATTPFNLILHYGDNRTPTGSPVETATQMNAPVSVTVSAADEDFDQLSYALKDGAGPAHGTVGKNPDGTWKYTPATGFYGTDTFTITASDGRGGTVDIVVTVHVNAPPAAPDVEVSTWVGVPVSGTFSATDPDSDPVTYAQPKSSYNPAEVERVIFTPATGAWTVVPLAGFTGSTEIQFTASDNRGGSTSFTLTVTVAPNSPPSGSPVSATTQLDKPVDIKVAATDADGDTLAYALKDGSGPAHGTAVKNADGTWKYTPAAGYLGSDSFAIHVSDGKGGSTDITVTVTVKPRVISGVLRTSGGQVLGSATIVVLDARGQVLLETTADEQGRFDLTGLPAGEPVTLKITRPGYEPIQQTVTFTDEPITLVEYTLAPVPVPVTGEAGASAGTLLGAASLLLAAALVALRRRLHQA